MLLSVFTQISWVNTDPTAQRTLTMHNFVLEHNWSLRCPQKHRHGDHQNDGDHQSSHRASAETWDMSSSLSRLLRGSDVPTFREPPSLIWPHYRWEDSVISFIWSKNTEMCNYVAVIHTHRAAIKALIAAERRCTRCFLLQRRVCQTWKSTKLHGLITIRATQIYPERNFKTRKQKKHLKHPDK